MGVRTSPWRLHGCCWSPPGGRAANKRRLSCAAPLASVPPDSWGDAGSPLDGRFYRSTGGARDRGLISFFDCVPPKGSAPELSHRGPSALIPEVKGSQRSTPGERTRTPRLCFQTRRRRSAQGGRHHPRCKHCPSRRGAQRRGSRRHRGKAKPALDVTGNDRDAVSAAPPPGLGFLVCETGALEGTGSGLSCPGVPQQVSAHQGPPRDATAEKDNARRPPAISRCLLSRPKSHVTHRS